MLTVILDEDLSIKRATIVKHQLKNNAEAAITIKILSDFISSTVPAITTDLIDEYNELLCELQAQPSITRFLESIVLKRIIQETHVISLKPCIL